MIDHLNQFKEHLNTNLADEEKPKKRLIMTETIYRCSVGRDQVWSTKISHKTNLWHILHMVLDILELKIEEEKKKKKKSFDNLVSDL